MLHAVPELLDALETRLIAGEDPAVLLSGIRWSELVQRITELWAEALGTDAALMEPYAGVEAADDMPHAMAAYLHMRVTTIYGGANEVQRNIIARRALGL